MIAIRISAAFDEIERKQRQKGKPLDFFPTEHIILDLETTGLSPEFDEIIEVAMVKINDGQEISRFQSLVKPRKYHLNLDDDDDDTPYYVDEFISELTGITNEMLETAPSFNDLSEEVYSFIGDLPIVGHNIHFDLNFLIDNLDDAIQKPLMNPYFDLLRISRRLFPELKNHKLSTLAEHFQISSEGHHRALADCTITKQIFDEVLKYTEINSVNVQDLLKGTKVDLTKISGDGSSFNPDHILYKKYCVFTGTLEKMVRKDAAQLLADIGGLPQNQVTKQTNFLIVGNLDYATTIKQGKSRKQKDVEKLILKGQDIQIITEDVFYDLFFE